MDRYTIFLNTEMLRNILRTDPAEAGELLTLQLIPHLLLYAALPIALRAVDPRPGPAPAAGRCWSGAGAVAAALAVAVTGAGRAVPGRRPRCCAAIGMPGTW